MAVTVPAGLPSAEGTAGIGFRKSKFPGEYREDKKPLRILLLNIMPEAEETEKHFISILAETGYDIDLTFLITKSYHTKRVPENHFKKYYVTLDDIRWEYFDGIIYTGAPLAFVHFDDVIYRDEWNEIASWGEEHVNANLFICWSAFAYLYYRYGLFWDEYEKMNLYKGKFSGIYPNGILTGDPLFEGMGNPFPAPHSRERGINSEAAGKLEAEGKFKIAVTCETGPVVIKVAGSKTFLNICHLEYDRYRLDDELRRDGFKTGIPQNYYENDDTDTEPLFAWHEDGVKYYTNWLKYYVSTGRDENK